MPFDSWQEAAGELRTRIELVDPDQLKLAEAIGLGLPARVPALIAAVMLREKLSGPLRERVDEQATDGQLEYLGDLLTELGEPEPKFSDTKQRVSAWLRVFEAKRALKALEELKPCRGDIVSFSRYELGMVVSISGDGRVNVAGSGGRRHGAYRLAIEARASDETEGAQRLREKERNQRAARARLGYPSSSKLSLLEAYQVATRPSMAEIALLREAIENAPDERLIQQCLEGHPQLLAPLFSSSDRAYVRSQVSLGGQRVPDFVVARADSAGIHWTLVELESLGVNVAIGDGTLAREARHAVHQIDEWREWLQSNLDFARRPREENGLGLPDIRPGSEGLVLIGRRGRSPGATIEVRRRLIEQRNVTVHSYDWLLDAVETEAWRERPGAPLDWSDWTDAE